MSDAAKEVTDDTFEAQVLKSELPVLVDLWAPWCGPCRAVTPLIEQLAQDNAGKLRVCKVNVDESPETAAKLGVSAIPTVVVYKDGEEQQELRMVGVQSKARYQEAVDKLLG